MIIYEKWNEDNTILLSIIRDPDDMKLAKMGGYLLVVEPVIESATEKKGDTTFTNTERSWSVINKTQEEQDEYQAVLDSQAARLAEDEDIANAILAGDIGDLTYAQLEVAIAGETSLAKKNHRITWALLKKSQREIF